MTPPDPKQGVKFNAIMAENKGSAFARYRDLCYGDVSMASVLWAEFLFCFLGPLPGALGLFLRSKLYPGLFKSIGHGVMFGRNMTIRHPHKISIGDGAVFDDNSMRVIVAPILWLEVIFILINGAMLWLLLRKGAPQEMTAAQRFAQTDEQLRASPKKRT